MSRDDEFEAQVRAALEERTERGNGWISLPSVDPIRDLPSIMRALESEGYLEGVTFQLTPSTDVGGWWDVLVVIRDDSRPAGLPEGRPDFVHQGEVLDLMITRSSGGQGRTPPSPPAAGAGVKERIREETEISGPGSRKGGD